MLPSRRLLLEHTLWSLTCKVYSPSRTHAPTHTLLLPSLTGPLSPPSSPQIIERAKDKNDPFRLMGFGHRVYRTYDPRAKLMRQVTYRVLEKLGRK